MIFDRRIDLTFFLLSPISFFLTFSPELITWTFRCFFVGAFLVKAAALAQIKQEYKPEARVFMKRYFIVYITQTTAYLMINPFVKSIYKINGMSPQMMSKTFITTNIISTLFSFFSGSMIEKFGNRLSTIYATILTIFQVICILIGNPTTCFISGCIVGLYDPIERVVFDNWFLHEAVELNLSPTESTLIYENKQFLQLVVSFIIGTYSAEVENRMGLKGVFASGMAISIISIITTTLLMIDTKPKNIKTNEKKENLGFKKTLQIFFNTKDASLYMFVITNILGFLINILYKPYFGDFIRTKTYNSVSEIANTYQVVLVVGTQFLTFLLYMFTPLKLMPLFYLLSALSLYATYFFYDDKALVIFFIVSQAICDGSLSSISISLKRDIYPDQIRGTLLSLVRLPASLSSSILLWITQGWNTKVYLLITGTGMLISSILGFFVYKLRSPRIRPTKEKEE